MFFSRMSSIAMIAATLAIAGCGGSKGPKVNYVEGVVMLEGAAVEGATVTFSPVGTEGTTAMGLTDANGVFKLNTSGAAAGAGAVAGEYRVSFQKIGLKTSGVTSTDDPNYGKFTGKSEPPKATHLLPVAYESPETSGFQVTVKSGKNSGDAFKFDLKKSFTAPGKKSK